MQLLGCPEDENNLPRHGNAVTRTRVAAGACVTLLHRERTEATKLNPVPSRERIPDSAEDRIHDGLDVTLMQMTMLIGKCSYQFGFDHGWCRSLTWRGFYKAARALGERQAVNPASPFALLKGERDLIRCNETWVIGRIALEPRSHPGRRSRVRRRLSPRCVSRRCNWPRARAPGSHASKLPSQNRTQG